MTEPTNHDQTEPDTESDPSLDDGEATDWTGEGGATPDGPATAEDSDE